MIKNMVLEFSDFLMVTYSMGRFIIYINFYSLCIIKDLIKVNLALALSKMDNHNDNIFL